MNSLKNSSKKNLFFLFFFLTAFLLSVSSCNNGDKNASDSEQKKNGDSTSQKSSAELAPAAGLAPSVKLPIFKWERTDIEKLFGPGKKNPGKMLIKIGYDNYNNHISTMSLVVYPAKDHKQFAKNEEGIEIVKDESLGENEVNNTFIIGNNDFDFDKFFNGAGPNRTLKDFIFAEFIPTTYTDPNGKNHLIFNIILVKDTKKPKVLMDENLGNSNPSPPADPSHN